MTISIARLTADSGVKYLMKTTMQDDLMKPVADATTYYVKAGTPSGRWLGSGLAGISRQPLDMVAMADASAVFSHAQHPGTAAQLGREHGRTTIAHRNGEEQQRHAVAGFDLTFSVPKSVSVLWALAPKDVQQQILSAHHAAIATTLLWLEESALHTRAGRNGVAHLGTKGAIAASFDHWESRAGDPQLHTHLVIANRVQRSTDGAWATLDSRTMYKAVVAASEHYNGLLFDELQRSIGTDAEFRIPTSKLHNPSHELAGINTALIREFSNRSRLIDVETDRLVTAWATEHGRKPSATTVVKLRQQATLSTRTPKDETPKPLSKLAETWRRRARAQGFEPRSVVSDTISRSHRRPVSGADLTTAWIDAAATLTREGVALRRATWNRWNLLAEAERVCGDIRCSSPADRRRMIDVVTASAEAQSIPLNTYRYSLPLDAAADLAFAGRSAFDFHGARLYSDAGILANEQLIMDARNDGGAPATPSASAAEQLTSYRHPAGYGLASDQWAAALAVLTGGNRLDAVVGPAGSGKTTTMAAIKLAWEQAHGEGSVVGLAPAAASAEVLTRQLGVAAENVAKWLYETVGQGAAARAERFLDLETAQATSPRARLRTAQYLTGLAMQQAQWQFKPNQLVIVDEASMVSTVQLAALVHQVSDADAKLLLVGDPAQLDAIDAGGMLGWLHRSDKAVELTSIRRFTHDWEGAASLKLRTGDFEGVEMYNAHGRILHGEFAAMIDGAYQGWAADTKASLSSILIAPDNDTVAILNERAHADKVAAGLVDAEHTVELSDGLRAGQGDTIIARKNNRSLTDSHGDFLRNGTLIEITQLPRRDGSATGRRLDAGTTVTLPASYLVASAELGYATTAHRSQGITVDTSHTVITQGCLTRELFYVGMTRGRSSNAAYICETNPLSDEPLTAQSHADWTQIIGEVLAAEGAERTAHEVQQAELTNGDNLQKLAAEYDYLAQLAAAEDLISAITKVVPDAVPRLEQSPSWGAGVAAWRRAKASDPATAVRALEDVLRHPGGARDEMAIVHARLRQIGTEALLDPLESLAEEIHTGRGDLADMIQQVRRRVMRRNSLVEQAAMIDDPEWKRELEQSVGQGLSPGDLAALVSQVAIYRDRWGIRSDEAPLGGPTAGYEWERATHRGALEREIERMAAHRDPNSKPATAQLDGPASQEPMVSVGLRL
ncbi:MobF family relaxase [Arthrobacter sp. 35W]|uniref:MobF family relaxase n=1 Tax=Arthrobacter sp. 35W TaxID=1132441 RepID=UPI000424D437|nr:MobF family relaxase [Arthrobacter sp. 35W]